MEDTENTRQKLELLQTNDLSFGRKIESDKYDWTHGETIIIGFIFYEFNHNYLKQTRRVFVQLVFFNVVRLDAGKTCHTPTYR